MRAVGIVALNTFREAVRDRVMYNLIFFAVLMIGSAVLVGQISLGIEHQVIINLGLTAISLFGLVMGVFIGVGLVSKEIEKRTLYALLAKPLRRWEFLVGKYVGLFITLAVNLFVMGIALFVALLYVDRTVVAGDGQIVTGVYFILLQLALVTAIALLFSTFSSVTLSAVFTICIYVAGTFAPDIRSVGALTGSAGLGFVTKVIYYLLPNFGNFNVVGAVAHGTAIPGSLVAENSVYAAGYIVAVMLVAAGILENRNLK
jgi:ABC-type transport system involved in multi-copper enzyme maturation permease subunit